MVRTDSMSMTYAVHKFHLNAQHEESFNKRLLQLNGTIYRLDSGVPMRSTDRVMAFDAGKYPLLTAAHTPLSFGGAPPLI